MSCLLLLCLILSPPPLAAEEIRPQASSTQQALPAPPASKAALFDELQALYPDSLVKDGRQEFHSHVPRNSIAGVHLLIDAGSLLFTDPTLPTGILSMRLHADAALAWSDFRFSQLIDVPVEENTGLGSRTEQFENKINPHVIRRAPFRIFEALRPLTCTLDDKGVLLKQAFSRVPGTTVALRLEYSVPANCEPGVYEISLRASLDPGALHLKWILHIYPTQLPPSGAQTLHYTNWFSPDEIARRHDIEPWSEEFWPMLRKYAQLMARGRQNTFWVRWPDMFEKGLDSELPELRRKRLERYIKTFRDAGLWWIEGAPIARRPRGDWSVDWLELNVVGWPATGDRGRAALKDMAGQLNTALLQNGWRDAWIQHIADEPTDTNAADYKKLAAQLREALPGVPIVEATMTRELVGSIDIWCPQVQKFQTHQQFFDERRKAGDQIWIYTCLVPGGPWLNRLLDQERLRQVYFGWAAAKYDLQGYLHWGLNHFKADPFKQSVVDHPAAPNSTNKLPAGDTHIVYPGDEGPWSSQRFEAHRIGMEDHALLAMLLEKDSATAHALMQSVLRSCDDYETNVAVYRQARRKLLLALQDN